MRNICLLGLLLVSYLHLSAQKADCSGVVTDTAGNPVAGVTIRLEPDRHLTQTNAKGRFLLKQVYAGAYTLYASRVSYGTYTNTITISEGVNSSLQIRLQEGANELDEVAVATLTKNGSPDNLLNIQRGAMPVTVITRETIEKMGSRRLDEILKEQTGMAVVSDISGGARATGIQMQGFGSEYIMILIDGQPMTGRNSGNFDLSRISVTNIERIEIVKGASSCLFGSDALGGAINIVTRHGALQPQAMASVQHGSLNITDATLEGETPFYHNRGSVNLAANYYHSDGYNTDPQYISRGTTAPPYDDYSIQARSRYRVTAKGIIGMSGRYALRRSYMEKKFQGQPGTETTSGDQQDLSDINLSAYYNHDFSSRLKNMTRYYFTRYGSDMSVVWQQQNNIVSSEQFTQTIHRLEQQWAYAYKENIKFTAGIGGGIEQLHTTSYRNAPDMPAYFTYLQADWKISRLTDLVGGLRYDGNTYYGGKINPSIGLQQKLHPTLLFKLSAGTGFKAPDFKNRYQVFVNPAANYMVIGAEVLQETLDQMQAKGEISEIRQYLLKQVAGNLKPETSVSLNAGFTWKPATRFKMEFGGFYHDLRNQINSIQVATGTGNRLIFTYQNLPSSFNTGIEASFSWQPVTGLEINGGYQYLVAKDRSVKDSILSGNYPWYKVRNNATGETFDAKPTDYWGIENRSRHMANVSAFYYWAPADINFSFRVTYRGKYAFGDANNNNFIDRYDQFVDGFFLANAAIEKRWLKDHLRVRLTADNILDYTDRLIPGQSGRVLLLGVSYRWLSQGR
jgi:outer membrane receptor for ferrienterochelin and colicins